MGVLTRIVRIFTHTAPTNSCNAQDSPQSLGIQDAAQTMLQDMRKSESIVSGSALLVRFSRRVKRENDADALFRAFQEMYLLHKTNDDPIAMSIAQILGERLYGLGHSGIAKTDRKSRVVFVPVEPDTIKP